jgi:hypothetical protein
MPGIWSTGNCQAMTQTVQQLVHGYQKGHSLLAGSCSLPKSALEIVTEQSDLSGPLPAGVSVPSHLTAYPVPDTAFYALGRTWPDTDASTIRVRDYPHVTDPHDRVGSRRESGGLSAAA